MGLNIAKGNMYPHVDATWNTIKGECPHYCPYCYVGRWGPQKPIRFDEKELKTDLGKDQFIFVGSSCDMFADRINSEWVFKTLEHCKKYPNKYLFQSKNPAAFNGYGAGMPDDIVLCTTIETNRYYPEYMWGAPTVISRAMAMASIPIENKHVTIEPIMDFDHKAMFDLIYGCQPSQVNIGADSGKHNLPEPGRDKIMWLVDALRYFTDVRLKKNLMRLL